MEKRGLCRLLPGLFSRKMFYGNCYAALNSIKVKDIMIKDVLCIRRDDKLVEAAHTMIGAHASCLVVLEHEPPIGIITERDFVKKLGMTNDRHEEMIVNDVMTKKLFTVNAHANLFEAQKIMREHKFRKLVIVENNELKGIITQTDLCKAVNEIGSVYHHPPLVRDVMTRKVLAVDGDDKFMKAKKLMNIKDVGCVLVVERGAIKGVFTEFDIVSEFFMNPNRLKNSFIKDLMTTPVMCISPLFDLFQANKIMLEHNFRRLPVIDNGKIVGMITQTDIARGLYEFIERHKDAECIPVKEQKTPGYCMKKSNDMIVCERIPPKTISGAVPATSAEKIPEKMAEKIVETPGRKSRK